MSISYLLICFLLLISLLSFTGRVRNKSVDMEKNNLWFTREDLIKNDTSIQWDKTLYIVSRKYNNSTQ